MKRRVNLMVNSKKKKSKVSYKSRHSGLKKAYKRVISYFEYMPFAKALSLTCVAFLIFSDFNTVFQMFIGDGFDLKDFLAATVAITVAIMLEGFPLFTGNYLSSIFEKHIDDAQDRRFKKFLMFVGSAVSSVVVFTVSFALRILMIIITLEKEERVKLLKLAESDRDIVQVIGDSLRFLLFRTDDPEGFLTNLFLAILPILTSLFCFVLSISYLSPNYKKRLSDNVQRLKKKRDRADQSYNEKAHQLSNMKIELWNELNITLKLPEDINEFLQNCFRRIRINTERFCSHSFERELERYNKKGQSKLQSLVIEMSRYSTVPQLITEIDIEELIRKYDQAKSDMEAWSFERYIKKAAPKLTQALQDIPQKTDPGPDPTPTPTPAPDPVGKSTEITEDPFKEEPKKDVNDPQGSSVEDIVNGVRGIVHSTENSDTNTAAEELCPVPNVVGYTLDQAVAMLENAGFGIDRSRIIYVEDPHSENTVLAQEYRGSLAKQGTLISLTVSSGPAKADEDHTSDGSLKNEIEKVRGILHERDSGSSEE